AAGDSAAPARAMDVISAEAAIDVSHALEWSGKGALRLMKEGPNSARLARTQSSLFVQRFDYAVVAPVGLGVEYRVLAQREAADLRSGWLNELTWKPALHLRV